MSSYPDDRAIEAYWRQRAVQSQRHDELKLHIAFLRVENNANIQTFRQHMSVFTRSQTWPEIQSSSRTYQSDSEAYTLCGSCNMETGAHESYNEIEDSQSISSIASPYSRNKKRAVQRGNMRISILSWLTGYIWDVAFTR